MPPVVNTPSGSPAAGKPIRAAVQSTIRCSTRVAVVLWSQVSTAVFTAAVSASAATAGMATGQLRWAM